MPSTQKLPPGRSGLPLIGETLAIVRDTFGFIHARTQQYGPVFRTNVLGTPTVFLSGHQHVELWLDDGLIQREGSFLPSVEALFGGAGHLAIIDGDTHRTRKAQMLAAFSREAMAAYLPRLQRLLEERLAAWALKGDVRAVPELKLIAVEAICSVLLGLQPGDPQLQALVADYQLIFAALPALPIKLPGTAFTKGLQARDRLFEKLRAIISAHRAAPADDGLSRILAATGPDGSHIDPEVLPRELHHSVMAGYIVFAHLGAVLVQLAQHADVRERLLAEVQAHAQAGAITPSTLRAMPYLLQVVNEIKRVTPVVPMSFGKARKDIAVGDYTIPAGWFVMRAVAETNLDGVFTAPATFDPDRFSPERAEDQRSPHAFTPQGAGSLETQHKCAGYDFSTVLVQLFATALLRGYTWELPAQDLALDTSLIPPEQKGGLRVVLRKR